MGNRLRLTCKLKSYLFITSNHLYAIITLLVDYRHVAPSHPLDYLHHGLNLVVIRGNCARKVLKALFITKLRAGRKVGYLEKN